MSAITKIDICESKLSEVSIRAMADVAACELDSDVHAAVSREKERAMKKGLK